MTVSRNGKRVGHAHPAVQLHRLLADKAPGIGNRDLGGTDCPRAIMGCEIACVGRHCCRRRYLPRGNMHVDQPVLDHLEPGNRLIELAALKAVIAGVRQQPRHDPSPDAPVVIIIATSGSTARPKGVVFTNRSLTAYAASWSVEEPQAAVDARIIGLAPLNTSAGCVQLVHYTCLGCTVFMEPRPIPSSARPRRWSVTAPPKSM